MNPYTLFADFLKSHYPKSMSYTVWMQKQKEAPFLVQMSEGATVDRDLQTIPQFEIDESDERIGVVQEKHSVTYIYLYPHDYVIAVKFSDAKNFIGAEDHRQIWLIFHLIYHEQWVMDSNRRTEKLIEGIHDISSALDLNLLLKKIVNNALDVIPFADAGLLHLYDPELDRLIPKGIVGFDEAKIQNFKLRVGESIAGKVYQDGIPRFYNTHLKTFEGMRDLSEENLYHLNYSRDLSNLHSLLCVPVSSGTKKLGVMVVHKFQENRTFLEQDLFMLQGFASQAAIAIQNASLYTQVTSTLNEMAAISEQLKMKNEFLQRRDEIHHQLLQISLENRGIQSIISFLNKMINKAVFFFDYMENRYHGYSSQICPIISFEEMEMLILSRNRPSGIQLKLYDSVKACYLYIHPIWLGSVFLGFVVVENKFSRLSEFDTITIEQSSSILALEWVKRQTLNELYDKKAHEFFNELLDNKDKETIHEKFKEFALSPFAYGMVALFEIESTSDQQKMDAEVQRFILRLKNTLPGSERLVFGFHNQITLLLTFNDPNQLPKRLKAIEAVIRKWEKEGNDPIRGGFGSLVEGLDNLAKSNEEAKRTLSYLNKTKRARLLRYEDLGVNRLFINHSQHEIEKFVEEIFAPLQVRGKGNILEQTLLVYMASNRSVNESTKKLHIHFNTLYQRLKKIEELLNVNFQDYEDVLKLQLACFLKETL